MSVWRGDEAVQGWFGEKKRRWSEYIFGGGDGGVEDSSFGRENTREMT